MRWFLKRLLPCFFALTHVYMYVLHYVIKAIHLCMIMIFVTLADFPCAFPGSCFIQAMCGRSLEAVLVRHACKCANIYLKKENKDLSKTLKATCLYSTHFLIF